MTTRLVQRDFSPKEYCFLWSCIFYTLQRQMGFIKGYRLLLKRVSVAAALLCFNLSKNLYSIFFQKIFIFLLLGLYLTPWCSSSGSSGNTSEINLVHYSYFKQYLSSRGIERERIDNVQVSHECNKWNYSEKLQMSKQKQIFLKFSFLFF